MISLFTHNSGLREYVGRDADETWELIKEEEVTTNA